MSCIVWQRGLVVMLVLMTTGLSAQRFVEIPIAEGRQIKSSSFEVLRTLGRGTANVAEWSPDGEILAVGGTGGIWFYRNELQDVSNIDLAGPQIGEITALSWHPDNKKIASIDSVAKDKIAVWDVQTSIRLALLENSAPGIALAWSPNEQWLAVGSQDGTLRIWDVSNWQVQILTGHTGAVMDIQWSPNGQKLASRSQDSTVRLWDANSWQAQVLTAHTGAVTVLQWSPNGQKLASGSQDSTVRLWDAATGQSVSSYQHTGPVLAVAWSPNNDLVASSDDGDGEILIWNTSNNQLSKALDAGIVTNLVWNQDGSKVISAGGNVVGWDVSRGEAIYVFSDHLAAQVNIRWRPKTDQILSFSGGLYSTDNSIRLWDATTGTLLYTLPHHNGAIPSVTWNPTGTLIGAISRDGWVRVWDIRSGALTTALPARISLDTNTAVWNSDWSLLAADTGSSKLAIFDWQAIVNGSAQVDSPLVELIEHDSFLVDIVWTPDASQIMSITDSSSRGVYISDTSNWRFVGELKDSSIYNASVLAWRPNSNQVAVGGASVDSEGVIQLWDLTTGTLMTRQLDIEDVNDLTWQPDGEVVAGMQQFASRVYFWNVVEQTLTYQEFADEFLTSIAWHPEDDLLAISSFTKEGDVIHLWNIVSQSEVGLLESSQRGISDMTWSPDGSMLASAGEDGTIKIWGEALSSDASIPNEN